MQHKIIFTMVHANVIKHHNRETGEVTRRHVRHNMPVGSLSLPNKEQSDDIIATLRSALGSKGVECHQVVKVWNADRKAGVYILYDDVMHLLEEFTGPSTGKPAFANAAE